MATPCWLILLAICAVMTQLTRAGGEQCQVVYDNNNESTTAECSRETVPLFFEGFSRITYEGPTSRNPLAFRFYNKDEEICARGVCKKMKDWLRFSVAFWHTFRGDGSDPFGSPTKSWPWEQGGGSELQAAFRRMHANFELMELLGVDYWCFHDRDIAPEGQDVDTSKQNLEAVVRLAEKLQQETGKRVLWGTAQLFKHARYMHGAATSSDPRVFAYAAAQVKAAMEATHRLGGSNFVFWGGREGYQTLLNTDLGLELDNMARFLRMAVQFKRELGFNGTLLLEPKPQEPTKHQYDWDAATTASFLQHYDLQEDFKLNLECNHATLAGHSCEHELQVAALRGLLGGIDANTGDPQVGWDTDQFLTDAREATRLMEVLLRAGGLGTGGINFDAKLRRESTSLEDLLLGHISGMDTLARGLRAAAALLQGGELQALVDERYQGWREAGGIGEQILSGKVGFAELEKWAAENPDPVQDLASAKAEKADIILSMYV